MFQYLCESRISDKLNLCQTANKRNKLTFIAEPLDDGLAEKLEAGKVNLSWDNRKVSFTEIMPITSKNDCLQSDFREYFCVT
jgi:hypothetical protein